MGVFCPACSLCVIESRINDHLDSGCALHILGESSGREIGGKLRLGKAKEAVPSDGRASGAGASIRPVERPCSASPAPMAGLHTLPLDARRETWGALDAASADLWP